MKCPVCKEVDLLMSERQGVEIDYCPNCRGVWLDRGELDKIIEKGGAEERSQHPSGYKKDYSKTEYPKHDQRYPHKKKHWLSELFD